jgi:hypothetical protein
MLLVKVIKERLKLLLKKLQKIKGKLIIIIRIIIISVFLVFVTLFFLICFYFTNK